MRVLLKPLTKYYVQLYMHIELMKYLIDLSFQAYRYRYLRSEIRDTEVYNTKVYFSYLVVTESANVSVALISSS